MKKRFFAADFFGRAINFQFVFVRYQSLEHLILCYFFFEVLNFVILVLLASSGVIMSHTNIKYPPVYSNNGSSEQTNTVNVESVRSVTNDSNLASLAIVSTNASMATSAGSFNSNAQTVSNKMNNSDLPKTDKPILNVKGEKQSTINAEMDKKIINNDETNIGTKFNEKQIRKYFEVEMNNVRNHYRRFFKEKYLEKLKVSRKYYKDYYQKKYEDNMRKYRQEWDDFYADCFGLHYKYGSGQLVKRTIKRNSNDLNYYPYIEYCSDREETNGVDDVLADDEFELDDDYEVPVNVLEKPTNKGQRTKPSINSNAKEAVGKGSRQKSKKSLKYFFGGLQKFYKNCMESADDKAILLK